MNIVILGAGAIGRLFGVYLGRAGHQVTLVDSDPEIVEAINSRGLGYMEEGGHDPDAVDFVAVQAVLHPQDVKDADLLLLAVKSHDTLAAVQSASHLIKSTAPILTLQTGLGNIEVMEQVVRQEYIIGGFTFMAATALGPGVVRQGGLGKTYIGEPFGAMSDRVNDIAKLFSDSGLACTPVHRFLGRLWCKVIVLSAINSLSAVLQVKNGSLLESMESITLMKRLVDEGREVARAQSVDLVFHDLYTLLFEACRRTEHNISSMLQDILNGHRTEIEAQCEALVTYGAQTGVATPTQQTMVDLVRFVERKAMNEGMEGGLR
jgi:2-dehydropantoate 2-reductase